MEALISGELGVATLFDGNYADVEWVDGRKARMTASAARNMHRAARDNLSFKNCTKSAVLKSLRMQWIKDRALLLLLILLDADTDVEDKVEILATLDEWMQHEDVAEYIKCVMYSRPLPIDEVFCPDFSDSRSPVAVLVNSIFAQQGEIIRVRKAWDVVLGSLSKNDGHAFESRLVAMGIFYRLMHPDNKIVNAIKFDCLAKLSDLPNSRDVVSRFLEPFVDSVPSAAILSFEQESILFADDDLVVDEPVQRPRTPHAFKQHVHDRIDAAEGYFIAKDFEKAERVVEWLVQEQLDRGDSNYAAITLCNVSEMAKQAENYDLQVKYAERALAIEPGDSRIFGHLADAYFNQSRFEDAIINYKKSAEAGSESFAFNGLLRVYIKTSHFDEAYSLAVKLMNMPDPSLETRLSHADILRSLGRYSEAIAAYTETARHFPYNHTAFCALAATLDDAGQYKSSLAAYDRAIAFFPDNQVPCTGKGHLLARLGRLGDGKIGTGLYYLRLGIKLAKDKSIPLSALASALRINGKAGLAIRMLEREVVGSTATEDMWINLVDSATFCGRYDEALSWLDLAIVRFGSTTKLLVQRARVLSARGEYVSALDILNSISVNSAHKHTEVSIEKARIFRRLNRISDARDILLSLLGHASRNPYLKVEATLLGLLTVPDDLLANRSGARNDATYDDWNYDHACAVACIEANDTNVAWRITVDGKHRAPFRSLRRRFSLLLAVTKDLLGRTGSVCNALRGYLGPEAQLIRAIAYWKLGLAERVSPLLSQIEKSPASLLLLPRPILEAIRTEAYNDDVYGDAVQEFNKKLLLKAA